MFWTRSGNFWKRRTRDTEVVLAQRHKRRYTIIDKLRRPSKLGEPTVRNLAEMNDVAGCRLVFEDVEALYGFRENFHKAKFKHRLKHDADRYDYVKRPKDDGYRGVHDVYSYVSGSGAGKKVRRAAGGNPVPDARSARLGDRR